MRKVEVIVDQAAAMLNDTAHTGEAEATLNEWERGVVA